MAFIQTVIKFYVRVIFDEIDAIFHQLNQNIILGFT